MFVKLERQVVLATVGLPLLKVAARIDSVNFNFIIDTGASISLLPPSLVNELLIRNTVVRISTANGQVIKCYGEVTSQVSIKNFRRNFSWTFVVADVTFPLLGYDFLSHYNLIVDCKAKVLRDGLTTREAPTSLVKSAVTNIIINNISNHSYYPKFFQKFLSSYIG